MSEPVSDHTPQTPAVSYRIVDFEDAAEANYPLPTWERDWEDALKYDGIYATGIWRFEGDTPVEFVGADGGEPEDQTLRRDWAWVVDALNKAAGFVPQDPQTPTVSPESAAEPSSGQGELNGDRVGWYEFVTPDERATTHIAYAYEDGSVYLPEGPDVVTEWDFRAASATSRFWRLVREVDAARSGGLSDTQNPPRPIDFRYECTRCGFTSVSTRSDLTTCTAEFGTERTVCGGEFADEGPLVYWWQIEEAFPGAASYTEEPR